MAEHSTPKLSDRVEAAAGAAVEVQCVSCKANRWIGEDEGRRLSVNRDVPGCEQCFMPMLPLRARGL